MSENKRTDAIDHILGSARYWLQNDDPDYPMCETKEDAIYAAGSHVRRSHYKELSVEDMKECRKRFGLSEMSGNEIRDYYDFLIKK